MFCVCCIFLPLTVVFYFSLSLFAFIPHRHMDWSFKKCWPNPEWWLSRVPLTRAVSVPLFLVQRLEELAKRCTGVCLCLCAPFACEEQAPHYQKDSRVSNDERSAKCFLYSRGIQLTVNLNETMNQSFLVRDFEEEF